MDMFLEPHPADLVCDDQSLFEIGESTLHLDLLPHVVGGKNLLEDLLAVLLDETVGGIHDVLRGTVVLFQLEDLRLGIVGSELQYVVDIGTPEGVDALGIVTHHADTVVFVCQLFYDEMLCEVCILILIHQDELKLVAVALQDLAWSRKRMLVYISRSSKSMLFPDRNRCW